MSDESPQRSRRPTKGELRLLRALLNRIPSLIPEQDDWLERLRVRPMADGEMGSLSLDVQPPSPGPRLFGRRVAELSFLDEDGVEVLASLDVDREGNPFEMDIWKTDFSPLHRIPEDL